MLVPEEDITEPQLTSIVRLQGSGSRFKKALVNSCNIYFPHGSYPNVHNHNASDCNNVLVIYVSDHLTHSEARNALSRE